MVLSPVIEPMDLLRDFFAEYERLLATRDTLRIDDVLQSCAKLAVTKFVSDPRDWSTRLDQAGVPRSDHAGNLYTMPQRLSVAFERLTNHRQELLAATAGFDPALVNAAIRALKSQLGEIITPIQAEAVELCMAQTRRDIAKTLREATTNVNKAITASRECVLADVRSDNERHFRMILGRIPAPSHKVIPATDKPQPPVGLSIVIRALCDADCADDVIAAVQICWPRRYENTTLSALAADYERAEKVDRMLGYYRRGLPDALLAELIQEFPSDDFDNAADAIEFIRLLGAFRYDGPDRTIRVIATAWPRELHRAAIIQCLGKWAIITQSNWHAAWHTLRLLADPWPDDDYTGLWVRDLADAAEAKLGLNPKYYDRDRSILVRAGGLPVDDILGLLYPSVASIRKKRPNQGAYPQKPLSQTQVA